jgi:hypothetical protein
MCARTYYNRGSFEGGHGVRKLNDNIYKYTNGTNDMNGYE